MQKLDAILTTNHRDLQTVSVSRPRILNEKRTLILSPTNSMEQADVRPLVTAEKNFSRPSTIETYESFESFMQTLAPSVELPRTTDDASIWSEITSPNPGAGGVGAPCADSEAITPPEEEVKRLKDLVALLHVRLDATSQVVQIQEKELCREMEGDEGTRSSYEKLLTRWRREVCILLLKQRVDALQVEQQRLQETQREQHLTVQLHESRALVEVLKQKERNLQAEIGILTTGQKLAEMTMRAEAARRQHELEGTVKGVTRAAVEALCCVVDGHSAAMFHQLERLVQASCRLDLYGQRLRFSEQQVVMVVNYASDGKSSGILTHRRKVDESIIIEKPRSVDHRRERAHTAEHGGRRSSNDHAGRANQLEVLLAATKSQLTEECMHARELQERIAKVESAGRESVKKATRRAQEQADRDLVAIKRQHSQIVQSLQQRISKLQNDHAKGIVAHHQLERRLSQQQQEFVHTLNQRDNELRKSLDAKEIEVNGLLDEQNALLNKLKKFWRPILNSSAAKIFTEKNQRSQAQTPPLLPNVTPIIPQESKIEDTDIIPPTMRSVETQTVVVEKKKKTTKSDDNQEQNKEKKEQKRHTRESKPKKIDSHTLSRLSTPCKKNKLDSKAKKSEVDLISSYLSKLQKSYVTPNKQHTHNREQVNSRTPNSLREKSRDSDSPGSTPLSNRQDDHHERVQAEAREISQQSPAFSDSQSMNDESLPQYIICVPPQDTMAIYNNKAQRKKQAAENSTSILQEKLENLEALSETLLGQRM